MLYVDSEDIAGFIAAIILRYRFPRHSASSNRRLTMFVLGAIPSKVLL